MDKIILLGNLTKEPQLTYAAGRWIIWGKEGIGV